MITSSSRRPRGRAEVLRRQGSTEEQIAGTPDRDPLLDAHATKQHLGNISEMTFWRWGQSLGFPEPNFVIGRRRFWRLSSIEAWLETQGSGPSPENVGTAPAMFPKILEGKGGGLAHSDEANPAQRKSRLTECFYGKGSGRTARHGPRPG
jgi:predicted DNA-binding transcriptional regulator AlpA